MLESLCAEDLIIACSSGGGTNTAIAVIRISGQFEAENFQQFFTLDMTKILPRHAYTTNLVSPSSQEVIDHVVLVFYKGPQSYNGENILELSVHGNTLNIKRILSLFTDHASIRLASPGEFTYRALKNKKMTLAQVEGLDLFLNAKNSLALNQGIGALQGQLDRSYLDLQHKFLKLKASVELAIDFLDDVGEESAEREFNLNRADFENALSLLYQRTRGNLSAILSPEIVLVGQTNAGKSSLFNALLNTKRSIVSKIPGTTRDFISEYISIKGVDFRLVDTAGIRGATGDVIEREGMERSLSVLNDAFFKILIVNPFETRIEEFSSFKNTEFDLVIFTHADLEGFSSACEMIRIELSKFIHAKKYLHSGVGPIGPTENQSAEFGPIGPGKNKGANFGPIGPKHKNGPIGPDFDDSMSVLVGPIGPAVIQEIFEGIFNKHKLLTNSDPILLGRHRAAIERIHKQFQVFRHISEKENDIAIISSELNILGSLLSELIGIITPDEVLNSIFSNFCIGK